jgi:hypothetical protein
MLEDGDHVVYVGGHGVIQTPELIGHIGIVVSQSPLDRAYKVNFLTGKIPFWTCFEENLQKIEIPLEQLTYRQKNKMIEKDDLVLIYGHQLYTVVEVYNLRTRLPFRSNIELPDTLFYIYRCKITGHPLDDTYSNTANTELIHKKYCQFYKAYFEGINCECKIADQVKDKLERK